MSAGWVLISSACTYQQGVATQALGAVREQVVITRYMPAQRPGLADQNSQPLERQAGEIGNTQYV